MNAPLDRSPIVPGAPPRAAPRPSPGQQQQPHYALRCVTCQRMPNVFDDPGPELDEATGWLHLQYASPPHNPRPLLYEWVASLDTPLPLPSEAAKSLQALGHSTNPLDPFKFNGDATVKLIERFPNLSEELNQLPPPPGKRRRQTPEVEGWVCSCDPTIVNVRENCHSCG